MKNHIGTFALLLPLALAGAGDVFATEDRTAPDATAAECSEATLNGTYLFAYQGVTVSEEGQEPFAVAGYEVYDGQGNVDSVSTFSLSGEITRFARISGTYTVDADCTGSSSYEDGTSYDQFVAPDGSIFTFIQTNPGTVSAAFELQATARRVGD